MSDKRISQLEQGILTPDSMFPVVTNGLTVKITFDDILSQVNASDTFITGATYNQANGTTTFYINNNTTFDVTGYSTGSTPTWGNIIGNIANQTDLLIALNNKQSLVTTPINNVPKISSFGLTNSNIFDNGTQVGIGTNITTGGTLNVQSNGTNVLNLYSSSNSLISRIDNGGSLGLTGRIQLLNSNGTDLAQAMYYDGAVTVFRPMSNSAQVFSFRDITQSVSQFNFLAASGICLINNATAFNSTDKLQVNGSAMILSDATINNAKIGRGQNPNNLVFGFQSLTGITSTDNIAIGDGALQNANVSALENVAVGNYSLQANTSGYYNTGIGTWALYLNTTGHDNTAVGDSCLQNLTTGNYNTAVGSLALWSRVGTVTGSFNIGVGFQAGRALTSGNNNILIEITTGDGVSSGNFNTIINPRNAAGVITGSNNTIIGGITGIGDGSNRVVIGDGAGNIRLSANSTGTLTVMGNAIINTANIGINGVSNSFFGISALNPSFTGSVGTYNTAIGYYTLSLFTAGTQNTAIGGFAMRYNQSGQFNTAIGSSAILHNTTGNYNTAVGVAALSTSTIGSYCVSIGAASLQFATSGNNNTAIGYNSMGRTIDGSNNTSIGYYSLCNVTSGVGNTGLGYQALSNIAVSPMIGNYNIGIGFQPGKAITTGNRNILIENTTIDGITTGSNNIIINPIERSGIVTGSNNTIIGGFNNNITDGSNRVIIGDGSGNTRMNIDSSGNTTFNGTVTSTQFRISALNTAPISATDTGTLGEIRIVNGFIYVCVATNTWQRTALATF